MVLQIVHTGQWVIRILCQTYFRLSPEESLGLKGFWKPIPENCWADSVFGIFSMEKLLGDLSRHGAIVSFRNWHFAMILYSRSSENQIIQGSLRDLHIDNVTMRSCKKLQRGTVWHLGGLLQSFNQGKLGCSQLAFDASWLQHHLRITVMMLCQRVCGVEVFDKDTNKMRAMEIFQVCNRQYNAWCSNEPLFACGFTWWKQHRNWLNWVNCKACT